MQPYEIINLTISALAFAWMMAIIVRAWFVHEHNYIIQWDGSRPGLTGAGWAFTLWCGWWLSLVLIYVFLSRSASLFVLLLASDLGNLMVLGAAIAYSRAEAFRIVDLLPLFLFILVVPVVEIAVATLYQGPAGRIVATAPSAVVATAAMVAMGWAVLVRCGWRASPFFLTMCIYAVLQVPAFIYLFDFNTHLLVPPLAGQAPEFPDIRGMYFGTLQVVPYLLGFLKIVIAVSFLGYFLSPYHKIEALSRSQAWPSEIEVPMNKTYLRMLQWGAGLIGSLLVGIVVGSLQKKLPEFLTAHILTGH